MGNMECLEKISRLSVRIAKDNGENLKGSGVLFLRQQGEMPLVFTAAHVITKLFEGEGDSVYLHIGCSDALGNTNVININAKIVKEPSKSLHQEGNVYIHSKYDKLLESPVADVAMILLPWKEWMCTQSRFQLKSSRIGEKISGWGFPESMDQETRKTNSDILIGKKSLEGTIDNIASNKTCTVKYSFGTVGERLSRSNIMTGFSGTGLFSANGEDMSLKCIVSGECGDKCAGTMLWACSAEYCQELLEASGIGIGYPESFEKFKEIGIDFFPQRRKDARRLFADFSEELIEDYHLIPEKCVGELYEVLRCEGNRKWCDDFWTGKLKMLVMLYGSEFVQGNEIYHPVIQMPAPYENDEVEIEYLCTEDETETTLGQLIEAEYFAKQGNLKNGTIFVLNSKLGNRNLNAQYPRRECRQIVQDITNNAQYSKRECGKKMEKFLPENMEGFDIVNGVASQCNLAAIGVDRMVDKMNSDEIDANKIKVNMEEVLKDLWKE